MQRDSATPASQCRHSVTLSPGVPSTFLAASEEARLVESKAYYPKLTLHQCLEKLPSKSLLLKLSYLSVYFRAELGSEAVSALCLPQKGKVSQQGLPSPCLSSAPWNAQSHSCPSMPAWKRAGIPHNKALIHWVGSDMAAPSRFLGGQ